MAAPPALGAFDLGAAAWPGVAYQGPPPLAPAVSRGGTTAQQQPRCCQVCAINLEGTPIYFQVGGRGGADGMVAASHSCSGVPN